MDEGKIISSKNTLAHIIRAQAFQHYKKQYGEVSKVAVNYIVNKILVEKNGFTPEEAEAAEKEYYEERFDFLDDK
jgi:hypothetical protein